MPPPDRTDRTDHDLLVEANTNIRILLDRTHDQEERIRILERRITSMSAAATLLGAALGAFIPHLTGTH